MEPRKIAFLFLIIIAGILLVYSVYGAGLAAEITRGKATGDPPGMTPQPFHQSFIDEETCLTCHAQGKELPAFDLTAPKIGHEVRKDCVTCHRLPAGT